MKGIIKYTAALLIASAIAGCVREPSGGNNDGEVVIQLVMPASDGTGKTRAPLSIYNNAEHEYDLAREDLYVLVFKDNGGDGSNDTFLYHTQPTQEVPHPQSPHVRAYSLPLNQSTSGVKQRLVFLGNCPDAVEALLADPELTTLTKPELLAKLRLDDSAWGTYEPIPMWGESPNSVIVLHSTQGGSFGDIDMLFAVARVDVALGANHDFTEAQALDGFIWKSVQIFNVNSRGYVVPLPGANYDGEKVEFPSIVPVAEGNTTVFDGTRVGGPGNSQHELTAVSGCILVNETENNSATVQTSRPFLLIGGYYTSPDAVTPNTSLVTYYRVDFYDSSETESIKYIDLLRGHRYMVNISGVGGPGFEDPDEAINSYAKRMRVSVYVWDNYGMETGMAQGGYTLDVTRACPGETESAAYWFFDGNFSPGNRVNIFTDHSEGWTARVVEVTPDGDETDASSWLHFNDEYDQYPVTGGNPHIVTTASITIDEYSGISPRYGRIYITAGKWVYTINVEQKFTASVSPSSRLFSFWSHNRAMAQNTFTVDAGGYPWELGQIQFEGAPWDLSVELVDPADLTKGFYLKSGVNTGNTRRKAKIAVRVNVGGGNFETVRVPVTQDFTDCGIGGVTKPAAFGGSQPTVQTYILGGNSLDRIVQVETARPGNDLDGMTEENFIEYLRDELLADAGDDWLTESNIYAVYPNVDHYACWMLENSDYGAAGPDAYYGEGTTYYKYDKDTIDGRACPPGWRAPDHYDIMSLFCLFHASYEGVASPDEEAAIRAFTGGNVFNGIYDSDSGNVEDRHVDFGMSTWDFSVDEQQIRKWRQRYPNVFTPDIIDEDISMAYLGDGSETGTVYAIRPREGMKFYCDFNGIRPDDHAQLFMPVRCVKDLVYQYE